MLHRIIIGENVNNVIAIKRLNTKLSGDILYKCKCGLCGAEILRPELKLKSMRALPCAACCKKYNIQEITQRHSTVEE